jgi:hypothetical protein
VKSAGNVAYSFSPESLRGSHAIKILEFLDKMRLIVIAHIEKEFVFSQALSRRLCTENILKTNHLTKGLGPIADVVFEKATKLPMAKTRIDIGLKIDHPGAIQDQVDGFVQAAIIIKIRFFYLVNEVNVKKGYDLL